MITAVHLGALAALAVLLVPMAMAGLHLSLNKILFFSCALFISLAIAVHLSPFLPTFPVPHLPHSPPPSCLSLAHHLVWDPFNVSLWDWAPPSYSSTCPLRHLPSPLVSSFLNSSRIVLAGDSQARLFTLSLLSLLSDPTTLSLIRPNLFKRHSDYRVNVGPTSVEFLWAPFESNLTSSLGRIMLEDDGKPLPDLLIMGSGLWHMLHNADSRGYGRGLRSLADLARSLSSSRGGDAPTPPRMFWLGLPELVNSMLNTKEKRERMGRAACEAYTRELAGSGLLRVSGGPFVLLDIGRLSRSCGERCTEDGMHYGEFVYEAAVQIMLNTLLMESWPGQG